MTNRVALPDAAGAEEIETVLVAHMRHQILAGLLPPGTRLGEEALGTIFGVNRSRVRRILHTLALERLVDLKAHCGASIATPSIQEARDVFEARRTIERVTTEIVSRTIQTPRLAELRALVLREDEVGADERQGAIREAIRRTGEFHHALCRLAHNATLGQILDTLILRSALIIAVYGTSPGHLDLGSHHLRILDFLEGGHSQKAAAAVERSLYALEAALDLREHSRRDVDLKQVLGRFGAPA